MRRDWLWAAALLVSAGCTSTYDIRIGGHVIAARDDQPVDDAIVAIAPCFGPGRKGEVAHCGSVDEAGAFRYASSGRASGSLQGVAVTVKAAGFAPVERFVPVREEGKLDERELRIVLQDARSRQIDPVQSAPAAPPPH
ncbi:MAG: hypothetical protein ACAI25_13740 [Planctomycetota bacterium]